MPNISADIVNALVEPVSSALRAWTGVERSLARLDLATELPPPPGILVNIELRGGLVGHLTWNFELPVARQIAAAMLSGAEAAPEPDTRTCADAVAELANTIAGNASGVLAAAGYPVEIAPPETLFHERETPLADKALRFTFATPSGKMTMFICVKLGPKAGQKPIPRTG